MFPKWQQYIGDGIHLGTICGLLIHIWHTKSCTGASGKTQILLAIVYSARYLDLFAVFISVYNMLMKIMFLAITYTTVLSIYFKFKETNSNKQDTFRFEFLVIGAGILAVCVNYQLTLLEVMWTFSEYLEAVAIVPQLYLVYQAGQTQKSVSLYVVGLFCYRVLYFWHYANKNPQEYLGMRAALVQIFIYVDYFLTLFCIMLVKKLHQRTKKHQAVSDKSYNYPVYVLTCEQLANKGTVSKV